MHACKVSQRRSCQGAGQRGTWLSDPSSALNTRKNHGEHAVCRGHLKVSLAGQDKPLLPSAGEYQLLVPQKRGRIKISSSFPQFLFSSVSCPLAADCAQASCCACGLRAKLTFPE